MYVTVRQLAKLTYILLTKNKSKHKCQLRKENIRNQHTRCESHKQKKKIIKALRKLSLRNPGQSHFPVFLGQSSLPQIAAVYLIVFTLPTCGIAAFV